jgi:hemerythrin
VAELAKDGHDQRLAQELLKQFETTLASHIADRDRIRAELAAMI